MKNNQYKQNTRVNNLLNRMERRGEIKRKLIEIISTEENLAISDIQKRLEINRNTFNYWINIFEKEKWLHRRPIQCEGKEKRGNPKTLVLDKKFIEWQETLRRRSWESYEAKELEIILVQRIIELVDKKQSSEKQYKQLVDLFKKFSQDSFGARFIFLLHEDFVKVNFKLSLTERGKKALEKIKRKTKKKPFS